MNTYEIHCAHACKNTCGMLNQAVEFEGELTRFYERLQMVCDYPDVQVFLGGFSARHRELISEVKQKLAEMEARGLALDGIMSSFDPAGV